MNKLPDISGGGLLSGVWFIFNDGSDTIRAWVSGLSGMEKVYINDELVSKKRSAGLKSEHGFVVGDDMFVVRFEVVNVLKGNLLVSLSKNSTIVKNLRSKFNNSSYGFIVSLIVILAFVVYAIFSMYYDISGWVLVILISFVLAGRFFRNKQGVFLVEEV